MNIPRVLDFKSIPSDALFVTDNANDIGAAASGRPRTGYFATSVFSPLIVGGTATTADLSFKTTSGIGATGADMHFLVGNNGATEAMTILNNGNVGIGTTNPLALLNINSASAGLARLRITETGDTADGHYSGLDFYDGTTAKWSIVKTGLSHDLMFANAAGNVLYLQQSSGNVGIGTSTFGANAATVFAILSGTAPTTGPADTVQFYSSDDAAGHTIPSFFCEGTNVLVTGQADSASSVRVKMRINGTVVTLLAI